MARQDNTRAAIGKALEEVVMRARCGKKPCRLGLMAAGSELPLQEFLCAARDAMDADPALRITGIGPLPDGTLPDGLDWQETENSGDAAAAVMESLIDEGRIEGAVALHYPFPMGVTTIGRMRCPASGRPMFMASSTGMSAPRRAEAMLRNAVLGAGVARALGLPLPVLGVLNLEAAPQVVRALSHMVDKGYPVRLGESIRRDGGALLRGNDLLCGAVDVCVTDTLTGNALMKVFASFTSGGSRETCGWGYGPSVGEGWDKVISIVSRASGAPVITGALLYTARAVRAGLPGKIREEFRLAAAAGLEAEIAALAPAPVQEEAGPPPGVPTDAELHGIDVLDLEAAVHCLWRNDIYAEAAMGCTGPVIKLPAHSRDAARQLLTDAGYL